MKVGYIDTSFLLSIIFQDDNYNKSIETWNDLDLKYSSLLVRIESIINIYKYYILNRNNEEDYSGKQKELEELLSNINLKIIDNEIAMEIKNKDQLKRTRSLDSIHLATANILNKVSEEKILICSYDKEMLKAGRELGMEISEFSRIADKTCLSC